MSRANEYRAYLRSPEWRQIRTEVMERAEMLCELCGQPATQVHHVRYPKRFPDGDAVELLAVCDSCHKRSHGMAAPRMDVVRYDMPGDKATYVINAVHDQGLEYVLDQDIWRAIEAEAMAMLKPGGKAGMAIIDGRAKIDLEVDQAGDSAWFDVPDPARPGARRTLRFVNKYGADRMAAIHPWSAIGKRIRDFLIQLHKDHDAQCAAGSKQVAVNGFSLDGLGAEIAKGIAPLLQSFGHEIAAVKAAQPTNRPPDQFITVRQACQEKAVDHSAVVSGRQTADQYIGNWLHRGGYEKGEKQWIRASDSSRMIEARAYRRRDIYAAIDQLLNERQVA